MKNIIKRISAGVMALLLMGMSFPVGGEEYVRNFENEFPRLIEEVAEYVNPLYPENQVNDITASSSTVTMPLLWASAQNEVEYLDLDAAAIVLREQLKARVPVAVASVKLDEYDNQKTHEELFSLAIAHTGEPTEGDYLRWQHGGYRVSISGYSSSEGYFLTFSYSMNYYSTADQEAEMDLAVADLLEEIISEDMDDYEKVCAIYDWICSHITYDDENLKDDSYKLKHTAYAALIDRTAVCQGYALLLYRLLLSVGIDCRLVDGWGVTSVGGGAHGWNIICMDETYYNADSTWDASRKQVGLDYDYFLCGDRFFEDHIPQWTGDSLANYNMSAEDYTPAAAHEHQYEETYVFATCTEYGYWYYECECGENYVIWDDTQPIDHRFGEWIVITPAGVGVPGEEQKECELCHMTIFREIPALDRICGDLNGDEAVTMLDLTLLRQYLCGISVSVMEEALDLNGDTQINMRDAAVLAQYLAGLPVELH